MLKELYTAALGMSPQQTKLEVLSNNMANAGTIGFKRSAVFQRDLISAVNQFNNVPGDVESDDPAIGSYVDFTEGAYEQTGERLNAAIQNKNAFFVFEGADGSEFFTRAGNFQISEDGILISNDGRKLVGKGGEINLGREFLLENGYIADEKALNIKISEKGEVFANNAEVGTIDIVKVKNPQSLQTSSKSFFVPTEATDYDYVPREEILIRQGWLENSNVNIIDEMVNMIELQRVFEAGSKVIRTNDQTLDESVKIGRFY